MKNIILIGSLMLLCCASTRAADADIHLFILSGQSNMAGLNPEISFVPTVNEAFGAGNVVVIKDALGGQPIRRWYKKWQSPDGKSPEKTGDLYDRLMQKVNAAIEGKSIRTVTFVWMQGERDARESLGEVYAKSLQGLIDQLADDLGRKDLNVVIGRISDFDMTNKTYPHWTMVRDAQVKVAESNPHYTWVDTDDLNGPHNALHYTPDGYRTLGKRFADKAVELIRHFEK